MQDLHSRARQLNRKQWRGFTIVEVLIVVVVIAILAAVTVVAYNGIVKPIAVHIGIIANSLK